MSFKHNAMGREAIEGLRFLASLPRAGAGREKTQPFNWIHSRLFMRKAQKTLTSGQLPYRPAVTSAMKSMTL